MQTLKDFRDRIGRMEPLQQGTVRLDQSWANGRETKLEMGLTPYDPKAKPVNMQGWIVPITIHFDENGAPYQVQFPEQNRSGSLYVEPTENLVKIIYENMGRCGGDFLASVTKMVEGTQYSSNHFDPSKSLGANATGVVPPRHAEATHKIIEALTK